ncbi:hypothetical protein CDD82_1471 [Ophiocordyceps australis]|uniref:CFEM domain-containing protein n=1 Tax=Ophiocordyceps australis TaxID=1399860 RepID=A0A2C5YD76_9HYPO|nr:hypothetical protein CDD82_1471 [Ophiocordyceps australis]
MHFTAAIVAFCAIAVSAQDLSNLPMCAQPCFKEKFSLSGCKDQSDYACLCQSKDYLNAVTDCVMGDCPIPDALATRQWAADKCKAAGHPI